MDEYVPVTLASTSQQPTTLQGHHTVYEPSKCSIQSFLDIPFGASGSTPVQPSSAATNILAADWIFTENEDNATLEEQDCELEALGLALGDQVQIYKRRRTESVSLEVCIVLQFVVTFPVFPLRTILF